MTADQWTQIAIAVGAVLALLTALYILSHSSSLLSTAEKRCAAHQAARDEYLALLLVGAVSAEDWIAGKPGYTEWRDAVDAAILKHERE